jgi:hypothetical protein
VPSPERHTWEGRCHMFAQPRSMVAPCYRVVIYVSLIVLDDLGIHDRSHMWMSLQRYDRAANRFKS